MIRSETDDDVVGSITFEIEESASVSDTADEVPEVEAIGILADEAITQVVIMILHQSHPREVGRHRPQQRPQLVALRQPNPQRRIFKIVWKLIKTKILPKNQD